MYWMPYVRVENGSTMIRFYNTDQTKIIRVKVEGITANGNIFWFEKELQ